MKTAFLSLFICTLLFSCTPRPMQAAQKAEPQHEAAYYFILGYEADLSHRWNEAAAFYGKAIERDPASLFLRIHLAYALFRTGRVGEALDQAQGILLQEPKHEEALELAGEIYKDQQRFKEAIAVYRKLLEVNPANEQAGYMVGALLYYDGDEDGAVRALEGLVKEKPGMLKALDFLSSIYVDRKEFDKATLYLRRITEERPNLPEPYLKLGMISEIRERLPEAAEYYRKAVDLNPHSGQARERLVQVYLKRRDLEGAIGELRTLSEKFPGNSDFLIKIGMLYFEEKQHEKAVDEFRRAIKARPGDPSIRYYLSLVLEEMGRYDEAVDELKQVVSADPKQVNAFLHLAYIYGKTGRIDEALGIYEKILSFEREKPEIYQYFANALIQKKDFHAAESVLADAISRFPENDELHFTLAVAYEKSGRFDDMVEELRKSIRINPKNAEALNYLGYSFADKNMNLDEALSLILRALEVKPKNGYFLDSLGWVYYRQGEYGRAREALEDAVAATGDDPVILEHLGDVSLALSDRAKAWEYWERSLQFHEKEEGLKERVEKKIEGLRASPGGR